MGVSGPSTRDINHANHNTMEKTAQVFLFGDQTTPFEHTLRNLLYIKDDGMLVAFFDKLAFHLRRYLGNLPTYQQDWFPYFTTLIDLVAEYEKLRGAPVLKFALLCTSEIAQFIRSRSPCGAMWNLSVLISSFELGILGRTQDLIHPPQTHISSAPALGHLQLQL
jgi:hypothetical protein